MEELNYGKKKSNEKNYYINYPFVNCFYCVYLGLEKGFTATSNDGYTTFIGTEDTEVYEKALKKKGYNQVEQMGTDYFFENDKKEEVVIGATDKWCHWFRVFTLDGKHKIEDF